VASLVMIRRPKGRKRTGRTRVHSPPVDARAAAPAPGRLFSPASTPQLALACDGLEMPVSASARPAHSSRHDGGRFENCRDSATQERDDADQPADGNGNAGRCRGPNAATAALETGALPHRLQFSATHIMPSAGSLDNGRAEVRSPPASDQGGAGGRRFLLGKLSPPPLVAVAQAAPSPGPTSMQPGTSGFSEAMV